MLPENGLKEYEIEMICKALLRLIIAPEATNYDESKTNDFSGTAAAGREHHHLHKKSGTRENYEPR